MIYLATEFYLSGDKHVYEIPESVMFYFIISYKCAYQGRCRSRCGLVNAVKTTIMMMIKRFYKLKDCIDKNKFTFYHVKLCIMLLIDST